MAHRAGAVFAVLTLFTVCAPVVWAQTEGSWFGITLPPPLIPGEVPVAIGVRGPAPAVVPAGEEGFSNLEGERLAQDLNAIVAVSHASRASQELGGNQMWGRVAGFPSGEDITNWSAEQFRAAGISDVRVQQFSQDVDAVQWLPTSWQVTLLGDAAFGAGSGDVVLETAMALAPSEIPGGGLTAPIIYVGRATAAEIMHMDVAGKIAIQHVTPQAHLVFERTPSVPRAQELMARGAVAVVTMVDQPGNAMVRDFSNCGGPCFNLGGQDSNFLSAVMDAAALDGSFDQLRMRLEVASAEHTGLRASNAIAVIPGSSDETIVLNAHTDAWFDGAGDNGDGLAVLMGLARHFMQPGQQLNRTLVLVASAGHHTRGLNGPRNAVRMNPDLFDEALLIFNLEHVAQRNIAPARFLFEDGYRQFTADVGEAPIVVGITNESAALQNLFTEGVQRYGTNFMSTESDMASGEGGGYRSAGVPIVTTMQAPPLYHTSGEVEEVISIPGMERMARFMAFFVKQVDQLDIQQIGGR
ncbi:MAG: M28 family peptidase [Gammaproteobacteria bacterium]